MGLSYTQRNLIVRSLVEQKVLIKIPNREYFYRLGSSNISYDLMRARWFIAGVIFPLEEIIQHTYDQKTLDLILFNLTDLRKL